MLEAMEGGTFNAAEIARIDQRQAALVAALPQRY